RPHTGHAQGEGRFGRGHFLHRPADGGEFAVVHFAQKQERDVHALRRRPLHLRPGLRQGLLERGGAGADFLADLDTDERARARHVSYPFPLVSRSRYWATRRSSSPAVTVSSRDRPKPSTAKLAALIPATTACGSGCPAERLAASAPAKVSPAPV